MSVHGYKFYIIGPLCGNPLFTKDITTSYNTCHTAHKNNVYACIIPNQDTSKWSPWILGISTTLLLVLLKLHDAVTSLSANGSPAFIWKLGCHWLKCFWHLLGHFRALVMLILPDAVNFLANGNPAFIWKLLYHWSVRQGRCNADSHAQSPSYMLLNITCVA